jgi:hypothetical protein
MSGYLQPYVLRDHQLGCRDARGAGGWNFNNHPVLRQDIQHFNYLFVKGTRSSSKTTVLSHLQRTPVCYARDLDGSQFGERNCTSSRYSLGGEHVRTWYSYPGNSVVTGKNKKLPRKVHVSVSEGCAYAVSSFPGSCNSYKQKHWGPSRSEQQHPRIIDNHQSFHTHEM